MEFCGKLPALLQLQPQPKPKPKLKLIPMPATLSLVDLKLSCHLGVSDAERRKTQTVLCTAVFPVPSLSRAALEASENGELRIEN